MLFTSKGPGRCNGDPLGSGESHPFFLPPCFFFLYCIGSRGIRSIHSTAILLEAPLAPKTFSMLDVCFYDRWKTRDIVGPSSWSYKAHLKAATGEGRPGLRILKIGGMACSLGKDGQHMVAGGDIRALVRDASISPKASPQSGVSVPDVRLRARPSSTTSPDTPPSCPGAAHMPCVGLSSNLVVRLILHCL